MLDPGRYFAEAIYFLQYTLAQILWAINRASLSIAVIAESVNRWVTDNVGYFVELLVNGLSAPLGGMFILALTALGFWYALNNIVPTGRWVDPSKLFTYGLIAFFFFSSPIVVVEMMEDLRTALNNGIDMALIDGATGDIFDTSMDGTDTGLPGAIADVNSDGVIGSFDLVAAFMSVANLDELDSAEFPVDFEAAYFPFGDPSGIDLSDEADQELAKALASDGIERLFFAFIAIPTAIAEHFLHLSLTGVAMFLYAGVPFAMLFAFFIYTQAFLGAYLRQFVNLLIETLMSVIIVSIMIGLLSAAAQQGIGLYIGASVIVFIVILWRIKSALKLATAAFDLFGGGVLSGGANGADVARMGRQAVTGAVGFAGAALTGGATMALGGAALATASAIQADGRADGAYLGTDPDKTDGRVRQLKAIAGYAMGRSETGRRVIEGSHEVRTLARNFRDGEVQEHDPDMLDYLRAGSSMSGFGSSPWLAMRTSPSLRAAFDQIGGTRYPARDAAFDGDGEPVDLPRAMGGNGRSSRNNPLPDENTTPQRRNEPPTATATPIRTPPPDQQGAANGNGVGIVGNGTIRFEAPDPYHQQAAQRAIDRLHPPDAPDGQADYRTLTVYTGQRNADLIQAAVAQHTATAVHEAIAATNDLVAQYRSQNMDDAAILTAFQSGEAATAIREEAGSSLSADQLTAIADMTLRPQRRLTRTELMAVIGQQVAAGKTNEQAVVQAIGSPVGFGGQTGNVRGVMAGARAMNLSSADLTQLAELIRNGLREQAQQTLVRRGVQPAQAREFIGDMSALPSALVVPQSAAMTPTAVNRQQDLEE